jgi:methylthioxylose transferase
MLAARGGALTVTAMEAGTGALRLARRGPELWLPAGAAALAGATIAYGLLARAGDVRLGASLAPFLADWDPSVRPSAVPAAALLVAGVLAAPRLREPRVGPYRFALAALGLGLALRLALGIVRRGPDGLYAVYELGNHEADSEYLPALPAFEFGTRFFLDTFAEIGASLPVHAIGHPPGLLVTMHWLGVDTAPGMAALTIGAGALSIPLAYLLARTLLEERRARVATLLYVFAPSAVLYGATSADALYVTLALLAALPLARAAVATRGPLEAAAGGGALALASFFSYANLAVGAWATLLAAQRIGLRRAAGIAAACGLALIAFYAGLHLATGYDPIGVVAAAESVYREGIASRRPYEFWVFGSPTAFLVALGLPTAWFALRSAGAGNAAARALLAVLVAAAVLGFTKAETERIYQFLVPLACAAAAATLPERRLPLVLGALAAQALTTELLLYTVW